MPRTPEATLGVIATPPDAIAGTPERAAPAASAATPDGATAASGEASVSGTAAGVAGKPVTLTEILGAASTTPKGTEPGPKSPALAPSEDQQQLPLWPPEIPAIPASPATGALSGAWPMGYWNPYAAAQPGWPAYGADVQDYQAMQAAYQQDASADGQAKPAPGSAVPPMFAQPGMAGISMMMPPTPSGLEKDSPRSVILTLSGAWGALKGAGPQVPGSKEETLPGATPGIAEATPPRDSSSVSLSRNDLLGFRKASAAGRGQRPDALRSLRVFAKK